MQNKVARIQGLPYEHSTIQNNLGNAIDSHSSVLNAAFTTSTNSTTGGVTIAASNLGAVTGTTGTYSGAVSGASVASNNGFKALLDTGTYASSSYTANAVTPFIMNFAPTAPSPTQFLTWVACRPGSVTGLGLAAYNLPAAGTITLTIYKNGSLLATATIALSATAGYAVTFPKGTYTFVAGDYLQFKFSFPSGGNITLSLNPEVELGA